MNNHIGIVGIGVMGSNIALNFSDNDANVSVYNKSHNKINQLISEDSSNNISGFTDLEEFVKSIPKPRKILILVPSGEATKSVVENLFNFIEEKDTLIDGGNAYYLDSIDLGKRCNEQGIEFIGMGISGGETGARTGPALMLGYEKEIPEDLMSLIRKVAAKADGIECVGLYKGFGTGHFIKMLHNGIEYAEMQILAEAYNILRNAGFNNIAASEFFNNLKKEQQSSYLIEITSKILKTQKDGEYLIDKIKPNANHKGTGKLTIETSLNYGFPLPSIFEAFNARVESNYQKIWPIATKNIKIKIDPNELKEAIYFSRLSTLTQGILFVEYFSKQENLEIKIGDVMQNWLEGCIIRSDLLKEIKSFLEDSPLNKSIVELKQIQNNLDSRLKNTKNLLSSCIENNIPTPVMYSSLNWYITSSSEFNPSSLIQAQRDYFGAHRVQLHESNEFLHLNWD
jgi:6-phosphogluconate dehydrogenase